MDSGTSANKPVRVTIFHQNYSLIASEESGAVEEVAAAVDRLMHAIADRAGTTDSTRVAVLACLHLADQLRLLERDRESLKQRIDSKARHFSLLLDEAFGKAD